MCLLLLFICFLPSYLPLPSSHWEIFVWEILLLTLEWPLAVVVPSCHFFFFFKEGWPTGNAFGASPKPFLTPHRLASTLTANKTALFFSISKLGVLFFLNFLEMSWNLLFRLPAYFPLWVHTPIFCLFSKMGHTDSFPETFAPGQRLWLATALFH